MTAPDTLALPETVEEIAAVMRASAARQLAVVPMGGGTKRHWGGLPVRCDMVVGTKRLDRLIEHAAGDLVVRVQAGMTMEALAAALAARGQELALDVPVPGTTVGGLLATAIAGPRRFRYGTARDLLIGITVVLADGTIARSGGKVVKNVAGYDLGKLFTGSYGTLGVIADATFRLQPLPAARAWVTVVLDRPGPGGSALPDRLGMLVAAVAASQQEPSAIELDWPGPDAPPTLAVLVEGSAAVERALAVRDLLGAGAQIGGEPPPWWGRLPAPSAADVTLVEIRAAPSRLAHALLEVMRAAQRAETEAAVRGSIAAGVVHLAVRGVRSAEAVSVVRSHIERADGGGIDGRVIVLAAPPEVAGHLDPWGRTHGNVSGEPVADRRELLLRDLMLRVKDRFDPDHRMSPGRFPEGLR